jgi:Tfp pilus assembly protein PilP
MRYYEGNNDQGFYNKRLAAAKEIYAKYAGTSGPGGSGFGNALAPYMSSGLYGGGGNNTWKAALATNMANLFLARQHRAKMNKAFAKKNDQINTPITKEALPTASEIMKAMGIKDTDFDQFGNLKLLKNADKALINNGTQDDKTKYSNQYKQLQQYMKQMEEAKKAKAAEIKKQGLLIKQASSQAKSTTPNTTTVNASNTSSNANAVIVRPSAPAVDTALKASATNQNLISELKELNIRKEANQMVHYLQIIAKNQYEMARWLNPGATTKAKGGAGTGSSVTRTAQSKMEKPPTVPPNQGFDRKTNVSGKKDYSAIHAKNIEIARGGFFKDS